MLVVFAGGPQFPPPGLPSTVSVSDLYVYACTHMHTYMYMYIHIHMHPKTLWNKVMVVVTKSQWYMFCELTLSVCECSCYML